MENSPITATAGIRQLRDDLSKWTNEDETVNDFVRSTCLMIQLLAADMSRNLAGDVRWIDDIGSKLQSERKEGFISIGTKLREIALALKNSETDQVFHAISEAYVIYLQTIDRCNQLLPPVG